MSKTLDEQFIVIKESKLTRWMISFVLLMLSAQAALSNCYSNLDWEMPPIEFTTCFNGSCVDDVLLLACGGTLGFNAEFQSGYRVECTSVAEGTGYNKISKPDKCTYYLGS
jgi:hypothetical protein